MSIYYDISYSGYLRREVIINDCYRLKRTPWERDPKYIIDIGSNIGCFSEHAAKHFPKAKIFAFEMERKNYEQSLDLKKEYPNIVFENKAIRGHNMIKSVSLSTKNRGGHKSIYEGADSYISEDRYDIENKSKSASRKIVELDAQQTTFWEILESNNIDYVDFLKIDCEGCEYDVLEYIFDFALEKRVLNLAMEIHCGGENEDKRDLEKMTTKLKVKFDRFLHQENNIIICKNFINKEKVEKR